MISDVVIVGAGPVGCALAMYMKKVANNVRLVDGACITKPQQDKRKLAISYGSQIILGRLGIWQNLENVTPINQVHVSHRGHFGQLLLKKESLGIPALGYVVSYNELQYQLLCGAKDAGVEVIENSPVFSLLNQGESALVKVKQSNGELELPTRLAVIADGGSLLAKKTMQNYKEKHYDQSALLAIVDTDKAHNNLAYERFTENGPIALLPFGKSYALVWIDKPYRLDKRVEIDNISFLNTLQNTFGNRAGKFISVSSRKNIPLKMHFAPRLIHKRVLVVGNAAQALHPIAAQGLNLGLRDVFELYMLSNKNNMRDDLGNSSLLLDYQKARSTDRILGLGFTELLNKLYSNNSNWLVILRGITLVGLDLMPFLRKILMRRLIFGSKLT